MSCLDRRICLDRNQVPDAVLGAHKTCARTLLRSCSATLWMTAFAWDAVRILLTGNLDRILRWRNRREVFSYDPWITRILSWTSLLNGLGAGNKQDQDKEK